MLWLIAEPDEVVRAVNGECHSRRAFLVTELAQKIAQEVSVLRENREDSTSKTDLYSASSWSAVVRQRFFYKVMVCDVWRAGEHRCNLVM